MKDNSAFNCGITERWAGRSARGWIVGGSQGRAQPISRRVERLSCPFDKLRALSPPKGRRRGVRKTDALRNRSRGSSFAEATADAEGTPPTADLCVASQVSAHDLGGLRFVAAVNSQSRAGADEAAPSEHTWRSFAP